jgi:hypothetical protein
MATMASMAITTASHNQWRQKAKRARVAFLSMAFVERALSPEDVHMRQGFARNS